MTLEDQARDFKGQGFSVFVISNLLNLTISDVRGVLNGGSLDMSAREAEAQKLRREGCSLLYIANRLNFTMRRTQELLKVSA